MDRKPKKEIIPNAIPISSRPTNIDGRSEIGHWEGDLVIFTCFKSNNLTTLVERKSRFAKLVCNPSKTITTVVGGIDGTFKSLPKTSVESITFDRGTEFCSHEKLGIKTYFCDPHVRFDRVVYTTKTFSRKFTWWCFVVLDQSIQTIFRKVFYRQFPCEA